MELLAPGGNYNSFIAAINAGADAIYLGGKCFSARAYSSNFEKEEIANLIKYAHVRDVKVYVTINTLIFEDEFFDAVSFASFLYQNDVDGLLLQDLGLASYLHKVYPDLILHASTQLSCHNIIQAKSLINLGFKRIVLAREVSLLEAKKIKELGVEVEVFVQGALCVSYSGNCLMSSFIGGRSGNRGRCAQPCRHQVKLVSKNKELKEYAISTKDLLTLNMIEDYKKIGIDSLKIEGRMKREEYVYQVVSSYRKAIDLVDINYEQEIDRIKRLFNRNFTKGYIFNESRTKLLNQNTSSNIGVRLGKVVKVKNNFIYMLLEDDVHVGDGIKFLNKKLDGMLLTRFSIDKEVVKQASKGDIISFSRNNLVIEVGTIVNKTSDYLLNEDIGSKIKINKLIPLKLKLQGKENTPLTITLEDERNNVIEYQSSFILESAKNNPTTKERIITQLKKVDEFPYYYQEIDYQLSDNLFVPISLLNSARRIALEMMNKKRENFNHYLGVSNKYQSNITNNQTNMTLLKIEYKKQYDILKNYHLPLLCDEELNIESEYIFNKRINHHDNSKVLNNQMTSYYKECEEGFTLLSSYGNVTNSYALDLYFEKGYKLVFLSLECSRRQIKLMMESFYKRHSFYPNVGINIYGHIDYMIMRSCPISSAYNLNNDHCQMCKKDRYYLKDHMQVTFPLLTNSDCNVRVLSNRPVSIISKLDELKQMHINNFLIEFTIEDNEQIQKVMDAYLNKKSVSEKDFFGHYLNEIE